MLCMYLYQSDLSTEVRVRCLNNETKTQHDLPSGLLSMSAESSWLSPVCASCRERHLKCSGGPICERCNNDGVACVFEKSRRGRRPASQQRAKAAGSQPASVPAPAPSSTCELCRVSHLKCSGPPPRCLKCESTDAQCHFRPSLRGKRRHRPALGPNSLTIFSQEASFQRTALTSEKFGNPKALRSYYYAHENTCHDLARPEDVEFWTRLVFCVSNEQPGVRQIVIALGALHESLEVAYSTWTNKEDQPLHAFALEECKNGIRQLNDAHTTLPTDTLLMSCILLIYFETLQSENASVRNILRSALELLPAWRRSTSASSELRQPLERIFTRMRSQASPFFDDAVRERASSALPDPDYSILPKTSICSSFSSVDEAKERFDSLVNDAYLVMGPVLRPADYPLSYELLAKFRVSFFWWDAEFSNFLTQQQHQLESTAQQTEICLLRLRHSIVRLLTNSSHFGSELYFDRNTNDFDAVISAVRDFLATLDSQHQPPTTDTPPPTLQPSAAIPALLAVAFMCRDPSTRRIAITLLTTTPWTPPSWCTFAAQKVSIWSALTAEHEGRNPKTRAVVPQSCRIRLLEVARLTQTLLEQDCVEADVPWRVSRNRAMVPPARSQVRVDLAFALECQRVLLRYTRALWGMGRRKDG